MKKKDIVVLAGYYGFGNAGDDLILRVLVEHFHKVDPAAKLVVLSKNPQETSQTLDVISVDRWAPWRWAQPFSQAKRFVLGGGGLLQESTGPWNHLYYLGLLCLAKALGSHTEIRAIGVDPVRSGFNKRMTRWVMSHVVDQISVRDQESKEALESVGVQKTIVVESDLVFRLVVPATSDTIPARIGLAVSAWPGRESWVSDIAWLIDHVEERWRLPVDLLVFFPVQDERLCREIAASTKIKTSVRVWQNASEILSWMKDYGLIVGTRYHALVLAAKAGIPFVGWGSQAKVISLCRALGQNAWSLERGWQGEDILRQIGDTWLRRDYFGDAIRAKCPQTQSSTNLVYSARTV